MELSDESPLQEWDKFETEMYKDTTHEWVKESEKYTIRVTKSGDGKNWDIMLFHETIPPNINKNLIKVEETKEDIDSAIAQAEYYAENYKNLG